MKTKIAAAIALLSSPVYAQESATALNSGDTAWLLTATALVLFMSLPGLALFYGGLVRAKNVLSVLVQCFAIVCVVSVLWLICGYSLAFAPGSGFIGGWSKAFFNGVGESTLSGGVPESVFAMFQLTFAAITPALVVGGFAERMKFSAMLLFSTLWVMAVYVPVCHWVWASDGWLYQRGLLDFAGGTVVHITAGVAALVAAMQLGRRNGFPHTAMLPHNMTMTVTGAGMLWVGWFGFNGGSALAADGNAGMAVLVTHTSAAAGALMWSAIEWFKFGKPSALGIVTGMVAGLGTITPASGFVGPGGALVIGLTAGAVCFTATQWLKRRMKIDDSLDVFPVHGVGGILGTFAVALFASSGLGVFSGQGYAEGMDMGRQFAVQITGIVAVGAYTAVLSWGLLKLVDVMVGGLRVTPEEENAGLDTTQHNERGYDLQSL
ncbi:ammonium transporter [Sinimarinibacterium sp. CAU 1509]|uniref:ammonium transporter n=1 Tax=Sinimarinibacterium sp. CAU 1509 TaxID=2562283 RepID=UPI0010AC83B4|nr:ammonium transporter [Sinimarinibacterium sp. CAU 1509]TJY58368.1 ammonium transporter [Sinimarinibacterium sp. CAU 1509]